MTESGCYIGGRTILVVLCLFMCINTYDGLIFVISYAMI